MQEISKSGAIKIFMHVANCFRILIFTSPFCSLHFMQADALPPHLNLKGTTKAPETVLMMTPHQDAREIESLTVQIISCSFTAEQVYFRSRPI